MCETYDDVLCEVLVNFKELAVIYDSANHLVHIVSLVGIIGDNLVQAVLYAGNRVCSRNYRCFLKVILGNVREQFLDGGDCLVLVVGCKMCNAALCGVYACAAKVLLVYILSGNALNNGRAGKEHV